MVSPVLASQVMQEKGVLMKPGRHRLSLLTPVSQLLLKQKAAPEAEPYLYSRPDSDHTPCRVWALTSQNHDLLPSVLTQEGLDEVVGHRKQLGGWKRDKTV